MDLTGMWRWPSNGWSADGLRGGIHVRMSLGRQK